MGHRMFTSPLERTLLAAYLKAKRSFVRTTPRACVDDVEWVMRLKSRWLAYIAATCDLADHVHHEGEVETRKHLVKVRADGDITVIRYARVARVSGRRKAVRAA